MHDSAPNRSHRPARGLVGPGAVRHDGAVPSVLVIEDDDRIRRSLLLALQDEGYDTVGAATAEEGLARQSTRPADTVLVDLMLPGLDLRRHAEAGRVTFDGALVRLTRPGMLVANEVMAIFV